MNEEYPPNWEVPTLSFLKEEPLTFGLPRKQAAIFLALGTVAFLAASKAIGLIFAVLVVPVVMSALLGLARWQYARDPHWYAHATSHHYPPVRYTGS